MEQNTNKGAGFLKVTGILMIIGGAIALIVAIVALLGIAVAAALLEGAVPALLYAGGALMLVSAIVELIAGIVGVSYSKKAHKAGACIGWGAAVALLCVASQVLTVIGGGKFNVFSLILGLVLPALYIIGAVKNLKKN